jgi:hypothetical protein
VDLVRSMLWAVRHASKSVHCGRGHLTVMVTGRATGRGGASFHIGRRASTIEHGFVCTVRRGQYLMMGDNPDCSRDSL